MKKRMRMIMAMVAVLLSQLTSGTMLAASSGKCGVNITWTLDDDGNLVLTGSGPMYNYFAGDGPWWEKKVKTVSIGDGITSIGRSAFRYCTDLTSVLITNSVTSIEDYAFENCRSLTNVVMPNSVTSIGKQAFENCNKMETCVIGSSVKEIGIGAFTGCSSLTRIEAWAKVPPVCSINVFEWVNKSNCELVVPEECVDAYRNTDQWKDFLNISAGIDDVVADKTDKEDVKVAVVGGEIAVTGEDAEGVAVEVYGIGGELVYKGKSHSIAVPRRGIYIVSVAGKVQKVAVQ